MSTAGSRAGMAGMQRGFILDLAVQWRQPGLQQHPDALNAIAHRTSLMYFDRNMVCATTKAIINPIKPNSLKFTQMEVGKL
jgi:hypothetical protein